MNNVSSFYSRTAMLCGVQLLPSNLRIACSLFIISDFILAYLAIVCNVSCFIKSILLLLLFSNVSVNHKINSSVRVDHLHNSAMRARKLPVFLNNTSTSVKGWKKAFSNGKFYKRAGLCIALQVLG